MIRFDNWLVWVAAIFAVGCSCAGEAQELSTYWEDHDFSSLEAFDDIDAAEDKFDGYVDLLTKAAYEEAVAEMTEFLDSAARNTVAYMVWAGWFEPFLHAKESPYRNDELFVAYLDKVLEDKVIDDGYMMEHLGVLRQMMLVNRVGMTPEELTLRGEYGTEILLSDFRGERALLLFVDADCPSCLQALSENVKEYKDARLVAILVNGSQYHMSNIRAQLSEDVLAPWTFVYCPQGRLETEGLYDTSLLPFRMLVTPEWIIEESYF